MTRVETLLSWGVVPEQHLHPSYYQNPCPGGLAEKSLTAVFRANVT